MQIYFFLSIMYWYLVILQCQLPIVIFPLVFKDVCLFKHSRFTVTVFHRMLYRNQEPGDCYLYTRKIKQTKYVYAFILFSRYWLTDWFLVFNATFSNISAISWRPVLVVEEARVPGENHRPYGQATGKLYHLRLWVECTLFCKFAPYWW